MDFDDLIRGSGSVEIGAGEKAWFARHAGFGSLPCGISHRRMRRSEFPYSHSAGSPQVFPKESR
jgi:hypothetical protein